MRALACAGLLAVLGSTGLVARADDGEPAPVPWPAGWQVEVLPANAQLSRQRASRLDAQGDPQMVVELTRSQVQSDHQPDLDAVLLEMRRSLQKGFAQQGYQSLCTKVREGRLGDAAGRESTCTVTRNGLPLMKQTLVAAMRGRNAYSFSYAGPIQGFTELEPAVQALREQLRLP